MLQARLARQLKEAMAERQAAKSESKALQSQLDGLQKQVTHFDSLLTCFMAKDCPFDLHCCASMCLELTVATRLIRKSKNDLPLS